MKSDLLPRSSVKNSRSRRALAQPRFLAVAMTVAVAGVTYLATAQTKRAPVLMQSSTSSSSSSDRPASLADLPGLVEAYGQAQAKKNAALDAKKGVALAIGTGQNGYNLVESDLTPNTKSDEREPVYAPAGGSIAFLSNGIDADKNGKIDTALASESTVAATKALNPNDNYHVWVMNADGTTQRQISGLNATDRLRNQHHPSWAPTGTEIVYADGDDDTTELYVVRPFESGSLPTSPVSAPERRTFFSGNKKSPTWSPTGLSIVFACNAKIGTDSTGVAGQYDLFSISPDGSDGTPSSIQRLTGGAKDTSGNTTDDLNPAFSAVNSNILYFSSNRAYNAGGTIDTLTTGRRIWSMNLAATSIRQVTDPTKRTGGSVDDQDDFPSASLTNGNTERVAFQSNSYIDASDAATGSKDLNIWGLANSTAAFTPFVESASRLFVSDFSGNKVYNRDPILNTAGLTYQTLAGVSAPEGIVVNGQNVYVANSGSGQVFAYAQETGNILPAQTFSTPKDSVPHASGMTIFGNFIYVASGIGGSKAAINRFNLFDGSTAGNVAGSPVFSSGESAAGKVNDGTEGLTVSAGNGGQYIFASIYSDDKINVYNRNSGVYVETFAIGDGTAANPLDGPTGLTFGPDLNGDGFQDLYVCSSNSDDVYVYMGPNPANLTAMVNSGASAPGTLIGGLVLDNQGNVSNLNAPEGIKIISRTDSTTVDIYVSSFQNVNVTSATGTGDHINRYQIDTANLPVTLPVTGQIATAAGRNGGTNAAYFTFNGALGLGYFDFNALATASLQTASGQPAPTATPLPVVTAAETSGAASVITNILSSPSNYAASGLVVAGDTDVVGEDKAADREPAFARSITTTQLSARISFASTRLYAPAPSSNAKDSNGNKKAPSNPYGTNTFGGTGTHDIWGTAAQDTTPPELIPQAAGNQLYPVIAPGPQAPFAAPRDYDTGLTPGSNVTVAVVLRDLESGIDTTTTGNVNVTMRKAGSERFTSSTEKVNEAIPVSLRREGIPDAVTGNPFSLTVYDDGAPAVGGHELQADAVKGDGIYYCTGTHATPTTGGDYYLDISVNDQRGNSFLYDNVWGFSTEHFSGSGGTKDLLVSDYTAGQQFPLLVGDTRFDDMFPVESYYLTNTGGQAFDPSTGALIATSRAATFQNVDVWRTLCRGQVPQTVLDSYGPNQTKQIDPAETTPGEAGPYTDKTRVVATTNSSIIWAAPYAGTVFAGPGTITDVVMQTRLKSFLEKGGRLFVSGRDVAYALSNNGQADNDFLNNELGAKFTNETTTDTITAASTDTSASFVQYPDKYPDTYYNLQIPYHYDQPGNENYADAAINQNKFGSTQRGPNAVTSAGVKMDTISPQSGDDRILTTAYTVGGAVVGQRIEKTRTGGLKSRAVFFSFGLEAVNRRYRVATTGLPLVALDMRARVASNILQYFKTGSISGKVINQATNQPVPNILLEVTGNGGPYLVRTDANGEYQIFGLPNGVYTVSLAFLVDGVLSAQGAPGAQTSPAGFFDATPATNIGVAGGSNSPDANLVAIPYVPGSLNGKVVTSKKTPYDFVDDLALDEKAVGMAVLLRSVDNVGTTTNGGRFAQLVRTTTGGLYSFTNVPVGVDLELVFNPKVEDIPAESGLRDTYSGPSNAIGRRIVPDTRRPDDLVVPVSGSFTANDPDPKKYPDPDKGPVANGPDADVAADSNVPIVVPEGPSVRGVISLDGTPFAGATVELLDSKGASLSPARTVTSIADGSYVITDVTAGSYIVKATLVTPEGLTATKTVAITVVQGTDVDQNINIVLSDIDGSVTYNGSPAIGASVQLLTSEGKVFSPGRTATTDNNGKYILTNVPNGDYRIKATLGKTSGSVAVTVADKDKHADPIVLTNQQLAGLVLLRTDGKSPGVPLAGATVELLSSATKPLSPPVTTTSDSKGEYAFDEVKAGSYKVRGTYKGDSFVSNVVQVKAATATNGPTITLALQNLQVKVIDSKNKLVSGAVLTLSGAASASGVTNSSGLYTFPLLAAGKYTVTAVKTNLGGSADVTIKRLTKPGQLVVKLAGDSTGASNPTGFNVKGKVYQISIPYEDMNKPTESNVSERTGSVLPATTKVKAAFTVPPIDPKTGAVNYILQRLNPLTGEYENLDGNSTITRGVGYLLQVVSKGTEIKTPATSSTRKALTDSRFEKTFTVTLHRNPSSIDSNNGRNLIGFGFNPDKYKSVPWASSKVTHPDGRTANSIAEAVANGWLKNQFTTLDSRGSTPKTVPADSLKPFGGYTVQTLVDGLQITLRNPAK